MVQLALVALLLANPGRGHKVRADAGSPPDAGVDAGVPRADAGVATEPPDAGLDGRAVFVSRGCIACHSIDGTKGTGPTLKGVFGSTVRLQGGATVVADEAYLRESILKSTAKIVEGYLPLMPIFREVLSAAEVDALVVYVKSLAPADGG